jgi:hypothetical protein
MDVKVYKKEAVRQPNGTEYVIVPNVIDIIPEISVSEDGTELLANAKILTTEEEIIEQACALATIWQKGLDPIDSEIGVRWSEALLEEINVVQLMEDITNAVSEVTPSVTVVFDTVTDANGTSYLKYTLKAVA